jgi:dGTPase
VSEEFPPGLEAPLEGQLADLADEIAYTAADVEDALFSGRIDAEDLQGLELWRRARERAEASWPDARSIHIRIRATKNLLALLADDLVTGSLQALAEAAVDSPEAVRRAGGKLIRLTPETAADFHALQRFMLERVYRHPESVRRDEEGRRILHELFDRFREGPDLLPGRYLARVEDDGLPRVICDYLAGMTDRFCRATHAKLLGGQ